MIFRMCSGGISYLTSWTNVPFWTFFSVNLCFCKSFHLSARLFNMSILSAFFSGAALELDVAAGGGGGGGGGGTLEPFVPGFFTDGGGGGGDIIFEEIFILADDGGGGGGGSLVFFLAGSPDVGFVGGGGGRGCFFEFDEAAIAGG
jgi:hypothetical protein